MDTFSSSSFRRFQEDLEALRVPFEFLNERCIQHHGTSLLHEVARNFSALELHLFIELYQPNVNAPNRFGQTPLFCCRNRDTARVLLRAGAVLWHKDDYGHSVPEHWAILQDVDILFGLLGTHLTLGDINRLPQHGWSGRQRKRLVSAWRHLKHCRRATLAVLVIGERHMRTHRDVLRLVARHLWTTRYDKRWL